MLQIGDLQPPSGCGMKEKKDLWKEGMTNWGRQMASEYRGCWMDLILFLKIIPSLKTKSPSWITTVSLLYSLKSHEKGLSPEGLP